MTLPRLTQVGSCVLCTFDHFPTVRLFVREMSDRSLVGFDLTSGCTKMLTIDNNGWVLNEHGWPATCTSLMTRAEVHAFIAERPAQLRLKAGEMQREATSLTLIADRYLKEAPEILKHLAEPRAANAA